MSRVSVAYFPNVTVEFKERACPMSLHFYPSCRMSLSPMSHVEFKNAHVTLSILRVKGHLPLSPGLPVGPGFFAAHPRAQVGEHNTSKWPETIQIVAGVVSALLALVSRWLVGVNGWLHPRTPAAISSLDPLLALCK